MNLSREHAQAFYATLAHAGLVPPGYFDRKMAQTFIERMTSQTTPLPDAIEFPLPESELGPTGVAIWNGHIAYVACHFEDITPERRTLIQEVNKDLKRALRF